MKPIPLVRQVTMAPAVSYLAAEGVPVHRYLQHAGLSTPSPSTLETLIPVHQVCEFLSSVARAEGINDLGFRVCGQQGTELLGTYGRLLSQSLTIHDLIETTLEFMSSYNSGLQIWVEHHQDQVRFCQKFVDSLPSDLTTEAVHLGLATAMACTKFACSADWRPERIELSTDPIDLTAYFPGFADMPVAFNQPHTSIWLDRKMLSTPLPRSDSSSTSTMNQEDPGVLTETAPPSDPIDQLEQVIESALPHPDLSLPFTAAAIGTSPRTLQRRLTERGESFSHLHQEVQFRNALKLLRDPKMPLTEIAKRLGYTDRANFTRAFKRWTGVSPNEYRRLHYGHGHK